MKWDIVHIEWQSNISYHKLAINVRWRWKIYLNMGGKNKKNLVSCAAVFLLSDVWRFWYAERIEALNIKHSSSHLFLMTPSKKKTGNLRNWGCVCVWKGCAPLWWSVCHSCCRSLISARISGHVVSHSTPSLGFCLLPSGLDPELWTTDGKIQPRYFFTPKVTSRGSMTMMYDCTIHDHSLFPWVLLTSWVSVEEAMELELLDILSVFPSPSDFSSELSESTSPSPLSTNPRACSAWGGSPTSIENFWFYRTFRPGLL